MRVILTAPEGIRLVVVKVETNEPGLYGLGCATFTQRPLAVATAIEQYLKPQIVGRSPHDIEDIWSMLAVSLLLAQRAGAEQRHVRRRHGALGHQGQARRDARLPPPRRPLPDRGDRLCPRLGSRSNEVEDEARRFMEQGFSHVRCQVAVPGSSTYGVDGALDSEEPHPAHLRLRQESWDPGAYAGWSRSSSSTCASRSATRSSCCTTSTSGCPPIMAIGMASELEPYRLFFLEDPLAPEDNGYFPLLRQQTSIPLAMGELYVNVNEYLPLIEDRLIDFIRVHLSAIGGLTPARKLAALCEFFGVRTAWHGPGDVSPVGHAANLHLDLAVPNFGIQEAHRFGDVCREVFPGTPEIRDGMMWANDKPGLGIDIDETLAARYPFPEHPLNGAWPPVRLRDGTVQRP